MESPPILQMAFQYSILVPQDEDTKHSYANGNSTNSSVSSLRCRSYMHLRSFKFTFDMDLQQFLVFLDYNVMSLSMQYRTLFFFPLSM